MMINLKEVLKIKKFLAVDIIGNVSGINIAGSDLVLLPSDDGKFYLPPNEKFDFLKDNHEQPVYDIVEVSGNTIKGITGTKDEIKNIIAEMAFRGLIYTPTTLRFFDGKKIEKVKVNLILPNGDVYINDEKIPLFVRILNSIFENPFELRHDLV